MSNDLKTRALAYHAEPRPGKLTVNLTKPANTADDLTLAYSPGVAEPVRAIGDDAECAYRYTNKGNLVAVISNGSAILDLGPLGALASKPVMEGKGACFKVVGHGAVSLLNIMKLVTGWLDADVLAQTGYGLIKVPAYGATQHVFATRYPVPQSAERLKHPFTPDLRQTIQIGDVTLIAGSIRNPCRILRCLLITGQQSGAHFAVVSSGAGDNCLG